MDIKKSKNIMKFNETTNKKYLTYIFFSLSFVGIIISLFFGNSKQNKKDDTKGKANAIIYGYSLIIFSIVGLLLIQFAIFNINKGGVIDFLKNILENSLPTILLIVILYWVVNLNIVYRKKINSNVVPEEYRLFYTSSVILTLFQLGMIVKSMLDQNGVKISGIDLIDKFANTFSIVLIILNSIFVGMMQIVLKYYATDG